MRIIDLIEAFVTRTMGKGQVPFKRSAIKDPHIQALIARISKETGVPADVIEKEVGESTTVQRLQEVQKYSPILYDTMAQNAVETAAFNKISKSIKRLDMDFDDVKFDVKIFRKLLQLVQEENKGMFPLTAPGEIRRIYKIIPILVPNTDPALKLFNEVTTAAATAKGEFIFSVPFMQQLINHAAVVQVKPKMKKYVSNGGSIPDSYCYIEFLIMHEILHYKMGDFLSFKSFQQYPHIAHNWASDLRSNYLLVKSGYEQLPMGLFSDDLNFDRAETSSYRKLIKAVHTEMQKLPLELRQWVEKDIETDYHPKKPKPPKPPQPPKPPWNPQVGEVVYLNKKNGYGVISKVNGDGTFEIDEVTPKEAKKRIQEKGVGGSA